MGITAGSNELLRTRDRIVGARVLGDRRAVLLGTASGDLVLLPLTREGAGPPVTVGRGYVDIVDVEASGPGEVLVLEAGGTLLAARLDDANRGAAHAMAEHLVEPRQMALAPGGTGVLVAVGGSVQGVVQVDQRESDGRVLVDGLDGIAGLVAARRRDQLLVCGPTWLASAGGTGHAVRTLMHTLQGGGALGWLVPDRLVAVTEHSAALICVVDLAARPAQVVGIVGEASAAPVVALAADDNSAVVVNRHSVLRVRLADLLRSAVLITPPAEPVFAGSYAALAVDASPLGVPLSDIRLVVEQASNGCVLSAAAPEVGEPPEPLFCAGHEPGWYRVQGLDLTGRVVAHAEVEVRGDGATVEGPNRWLGSPSRMGAPAPGAGSGGPLTYGTVKPVSGTYRVAIILVDTSTARYTAAESTATQQTFMDEIVNGVSVGGVISSTAAYYAEVSYGLLTMTGAAFGPYHLSGSFGDYFFQAGSSPKPTDAWEPRTSYWQAVATAADADVDFTQFDAVVCVSRSVDANTFAWPWGYNDWQVKVKDGPKSTSIDRSLGFVSIPHDWPTVRPGRLVRTTVAHELGHTLRLGDVYAWGGHSPDLQARQLDGWDLMAHEDTFPHLTLAHRRMLGWVSDTEVESLDVHSAASRVDQVVVLGPVEAPTVAAGTRRGIEIAKGEGWQYLVEYRVGLAGQVGDRSLPTNDRVLTTELTTDQWDAEQRRKPLMLQRNDADGDGPVLGTGQDFEERDFVGNEFVIDVTQIGAQQAKVRVRYGAGSQPDPNIRPWSTDTWQSPDIEVRNARNQADPAWRNVPWDDHLNTVVATINNRGRLDAPGVRVEFWVTDMNLGAETWQLLGTGSGDVPAMQSREITCGTQWRPKAPGHYCIEARVPLYQQPPPSSIVEITEFNNRARSNYDRFISKTASTPTRERLELLIENPFAVPAQIALHITQSNPLYRTFLSATSLELGPREARRVEVAMECAVAHGDPLPDPDLNPWRDVPNDVRIWSTISPVDARPDRGGVALSGVRLQVVAGRATRFDDIRRDGDVLAGRVLTVDDSTAVTHGSVLLATVDGDPEGTVVAKMRNGGWRLLVPATAKPLELTYLGSQGFAPTSTPVPQ